MTQKKSDHPMHGEVSKQMHLHIEEGDLPNYCLVPGNPGRIKKIGREWNKFEIVNQNREYISAKGVYNETQIGACSTGIGGPSAEIAVVELANIGVDTFIRVGSAAALQSNIEVGDLIINTGAIRRTSAPEAYIGDEYPAMANYEVVQALIEACEHFEHNYHLGLSASVDSFYAGEGNPVQGFEQSHMENLLPDIRKAGATNFEMESGTIFVLANLFGLRAGCICVVGANKITGDSGMKPEFMRNLCQVSSKAVEILNKWDNLKKANDKNYFFPALIK